MDFDYIDRLNSEEIEDLYFDFTNNNYETEISESGCTAHYYNTAEGRYEGILIPSINFGSCKTTLAQINKNTAKIDAEIKCNYINNNTSKFGCRFSSVGCRFETCSLFSGHTYMSWGNCNVTCSWLSTFWRTYVGTVERDSVYWSSTTRMNYWFFR